MPKRFRTPSPPTKATYNPQVAAYIAWRKSQILNFPGITEEMIIERWKNVIKARQRLNLAQGSAEYKGW